MTTSSKTETNHTIYFTHGENGVIDTYNGNTVFSNLFMLGALSCTREYDDKLFHKKYKTDLAGLEVLNSRTEEAISFLSSAVSALGEMLAYVDLDNIDNGTMASFGWLISGLGELQSQLAFENSEITYALKNCEAVYGKVQS
ncbi:MAG: hypothetical protein ACXWEO_02800 [Methylobacter sp.]